MTMLVDVSISAVTYTHLHSNADKTTYNKMVVLFHICLSFP